MEPSDYKGNIGRNAERIRIIVAAVEALGVLAMGKRGRAKLTPQQRLDAHDALFAALEVLNDEKETY